jgi:uncharacterized protein (UPF0548 family)
MLLARSVSEERAAGLVAEQSVQQPTYDEIGASLGSAFPAGYTHDRYEVRLGDASAMARGSEALRRWAAHRGAGVEVMPGNREIAVGVTVILTLPIGPVRAIAACRIVGVVEEPTRFGFAYGTLPLHPEQGEETSSNRTRTRRFGSGSQPSPGPETSWRDSEHPLVARSRAP